MIELMQNPVTIIFGLLAVFFIFMSFGRHVVRKRNKLALRTNEKPYKLSDPYVEQDELLSQESLTPAQPSNFSAASPTDSKSYFAQYTGYSKVKGPYSPESASGYIWE